MEEAQTSTVPTSTGYQSSINSKLESLIDIPFHKKLMTALIALFNFFDIHAPNIGIIHALVTYIRLFQLVGGSMMTAKDSVFNRETLTFKMVNLMSTLFHLVPVTIRENNEVLILSVIDGVLIFFAIYLVVTAFTYKSSSKVHPISVKILSIFMAFGPYLLLPCAVQISGQLLSEDIGEGHPTEVKELIPNILTFLLCVFYGWLLITTYTNTIIFRPTSFASLEGSPQNKIFITTIIVTFVCALSSHLSEIPSTVIAVLSFMIYIFDITTVFNCGTFIRNNHQIMVLGGSILAIILGAANIVPCYIYSFFWGSYYFVGVTGLGIVSFGIAYAIIHSRIKKDMRLLDEIEETHDITVLKSHKKLKQVLITGFNYCHPICLDFSIFKLAVEQWRDEPDVWFCYAKFVAIYPENTSNLMFIHNNVVMLKKNPTLVKLIETNVSIIINTRETKFTPQLKNMINKIQKKFIKAKNRLRNIWDLVLQGSTNDMDTSIVAAYDSVKESESEAAYLKTVYPNNRFARKVYAKFLYEVKGDFIGFKATCDELGKLQAGLRITDDKVHDYGIEAFQNLPDYCKEVENSSKIATENAELYGAEDSEESDIQVEQIAIIEKLIRRNNIPAISYMRWTTLISFFFLFIVPLIGITTFFKYYEGTIEQPLHFMESVAEMRSLASIIPCITARLLSVEIPLPRNHSKKLAKQLKPIQDFTFHAFGDVSDNRDVLRYFAQSIGGVNQRMSAIRSYKPGDALYEKVRGSLFEAKLFFLTYLNNTFYYATPAAVPQIAFQLSSTVGKLLDMGPMTAEIASGLNALTARNNPANISYACNDALAYMIESIRTEYDKYFLIFYGVFGFITGCVVVFFPMLYFLQVRKLASNKQAIYKAMADLPKAVLSQISSSFNKVKANDSSMMVSYNGNEQETNRQEESIIKLFTSISDSSSSSSSAKILLLYLLLTIFSVGYFYICVKCYIDASEVVVFNCHHINFLYGANAFMFGVVAKLISISIAKEDESLKNSALPINMEVASMKRIVVLFNTYFAKIRLGGADEKEIPFMGMIHALDVANAIVWCDDVSKPPKRIPASTRCFSAEQQLGIAISLIRKTIYMMDYDIFPSSRDTLVTDLFQIGPFEMMEAFFFPTGSQIAPTLAEQVDKFGKMIALACIIFFLLNFICIIAMLFIFAWEKNLIIFTLEQFLRCPPSIIFQNPKILDLLSGNFTKKDGKDNSEKFSQFANEVINKLNDIFIVVQDETSKIILVNHAFEEMFGMSQEEVHGKHIKDFFSEEVFTAENQNSLQKVLSRTTEMIYKKADKEKVFIEFSVNTANGRRIYTGKDQTQNKMYEKLLEDEKKKSDKMLSSILPANLVTRVQAGEKNISFAVQSVSVLFLDIVEFTPWCGSHDAQYVMRMLNLLFKEFDACIAGYKTMTKIKCIGDCYMAAGGIFDEVNQPAIHSKEVVEFGRDTIKTILAVNQKENEKLRIRVGVNTGGPIVAGVIGTEKPTFEILGPAINIAHEMEHHGVPMKVHISRPVYELIYGQNFDIKERGEVDVKGGKMFTYLVEP